MDFTFSRCNADHLEHILDIQEETFAALDDDRLLRRNTREMLASCLDSPHITVGAFCGEEMAAFGILYIAGDSEESLARKAGFEGEDILTAANFKLVIVRPAYRGKGLQRTLTTHLEQLAAETGYRRIFASVSPCNKHSNANFAALGYSVCGHAVLYGGLERDIYCKELPAEQVNN